MLAKELITEVTQVDVEDTLKEAKDLITELCVCDLPVLRGKHFVGILPGQNVLNAHDTGQKLADLREEFLNIFINENQHLLDVLYVSGLQESSLIPVNNEKNEYLGSIKLQDLVREISNFYNFNHPGGIITLEMSDKDYQLSEISRIVESEQGKVLNLLTSFNADASKFFVTLKLNHQDIQNIAATFERFGYKVTLYNEDHFEFNDLKERYDYLMRFIDI